MPPLIFNHKVTRALLLFSILLLILCGCLALNIKDSINFTIPHPVEGEVSESEIIGVWNAIYDGINYDTIEIYDDGTYQQIYHRTQPEEYTYESERYDWYLKESSGITYLYLAEGKYFLAGRNFLVNEGWGRTTLHDPFSESLIPWQNELILVIASDGSNNLILHHLLTNSDGWIPIFKKDIEYFIRE